MELKSLLTKPYTKEEFYNKVIARIKERNKKAGSSLNQKAAFIIHNLPQLKKQTIDKAEEFMQGMMILPGTGDKLYFVGNPPKWHENPVQNNEYVFSLNRMKHWITLLEAYSLTHEVKYAQKVVDELNDWIDHCPSPGISDVNEELYHNFFNTTPWRSLEAGIRLYETWPLVLEYLMDTDFLTPELLEKVSISAYEQAEVLFKVCPVFWPKADHNHYLMENVGLLSFVSLFPEFIHSDEWKIHAINELERCAKVQLTEDGGQIEGCPGYHNGCVYWFCKSLIIAKESNFEFSKDYIDKVQKMLNYSFFSCRPSGVSVPWGDSNASKDIVMKSALYGYLTFDRVDWLSFAKELMSKNDIVSFLYKNIWKISDVNKLIQEIKSFTGNYKLPKVSWQKELKQVAMRTDWTQEALSVFFACRTPIKNNHAHIDPMSFDFTAFGKPLVVDPGKFTYREDDNRRIFKSAEWHNTLTIDKKSPFQYISSWKYGPQKQGEIIKVGESSDLCFVEAMHLNYEPAVHKRIVAIVEQSFLVVLDRVKGINTDSAVQLYYHIDSDKVLLDAERKCVYSDNNDVNVVIYFNNNFQSELLPGKVSDYNDHQRASTRLFLEDRRKDISNRSYITVIVPYKVEKSVPMINELRVEENIKEDGVIYTFIMNNKKYSFQWDDNDFSITTV